jgi:hypothetical protein
MATTRSLVVRPLTTPPGKNKAASERPQLGPHRPKKWLRQLLGEETATMDPLEEAVRQRLGGLTNPLPKPFTFKDARVLKEPWLWLLYFAANKADGSFVVKSVDIEDDLNP